MKYTTRIQPFISVSRKEADGIAMENKLVNIINDKRLDTARKSKLIEDGIARLTKYKADVEVDSDVTQPSVQTTVETPPTISNKQTDISKASKKKSKQKTAPKSTKSTLSTKQRANKSTSSRKQDYPKTPARTTARKPTNTSTPSTAKLPPLDVDTPDIKVIPLESSHKRDNNILSSIPSFMQPTAASRQKGGSGDRLYVKSWK